MDYIIKYQKYKNKYLALKNKIKNMKGGDSKKTVILYKADWCGHCNAFKNTWDKLQKEVKNVNFVTVDADKNKDEITAANVDGFPTIRMTINNVIHEFNQERTFENVKDFIEQTN